ncbi:MAG: PDZ domain-containing protein [Planctomycetes bacterium]|nr:PDZ domain-containing protein [Planctomycetota bacterium]
MAMLLLNLLLTFTCQIPTGSELHVSTNGDNQAAGTLQAPLADMTIAISHLRGLPRPWTLTLHSGTHYLSQPITLTSSDSGTPGQPFTIRALPGTRPRLSGGISLATVEWQPATEMPTGTLVSKLAPEIRLDAADAALYSLAGSTPLRMARYPNFDASIAIFGGYAADALSPARIASWQDPTHGFVHSLHRGGWGGDHWRIVSRNSDATLAFEGGWMNNRPSGMHPSHRFVEHIKEELDVPGEWFWQAQSNQLFLMPPAGAKLSSLVLANIPCLISVTGEDALTPVKHVRVQGIDFSHTTRTFMQTNEPLLRSDWMIHRGGALMLQNVNDLIIQDCDFYDLGGNAIFTSGYADGVGIQGCHITRVGAGGVQFVGLPQAVRSPSFHYGQSVPFDQLDLAPGPKSEDYPRNSWVQDCLIHDIGQVEKQVAGVQISMASGITVRNCSIYQLPRAGINISEGTWGGHLIEGNDVFQTVLMTSDHGAFNSWGRDRFWHPNRGTMNQFTSANPNSITLDAKTTTVLRRNRWRCDHGWDIDLDDGSSNYLVEQNLCLSGGIKLREGFLRTVRSNICLNNSLHPHVWFEGSGDVVESNIFGTWYRPIRLAGWGTRVDRNFFANASMLEKSHELKLDTNGAAGDPLFVDPLTSNFQVAGNSPALQVGFQNFPMRFGVTSPRLRRLASAPAIPPLRGEWAGPNEPPVGNWLGGSVQAVQNLALRSAVGLAKNRGVIVHSAPAGQQIYQLGIQAGDVVLALNQIEVNTPQQLISAWENLGTNKRSIKIWRNQAEAVITP